MNEGVRLPKRFSFLGGIFPQNHSDSNQNLPIETLPSPDRVIIPLIQHAGSPAIPIVKQNERVTICQPIAAPGGFISSSVHASVAGTVRSIGNYPGINGNPVLSIEIENDHSEERFPLPENEKPWREAAPGELVQKIASAGICGMGGAGFPTHVKLSPPSNKVIDNLIINGAECEPFVNVDNRLLIEKTDDILTGALILKKILGAKKCYIAICTKRADAFSSIQRKLDDPRFKDLCIAPITDKYPIGNERLLIKAITKRELPSGALPIEVGCIVQNISTVLAVRDAIIDNTPLIQRVITVSNPSTQKSRNFLVRIGTPIQTVLNTMKIDIKKVGKVVVGGPLMGRAIDSFNIPVTKTTTGIILFNDQQELKHEYPCINCGKCVQVCPMKLVPTKLYKLSSRGLFDEIVNWNVKDCIECGSCAYICPSGINLVQHIKLGKFQSNHLQKKQKISKEIRKNA